MPGDPARKHATYEDVLAAPEDCVAELIHGSLYVQPRPRLRHARAASRLGGALSGFDADDGGPGGWVILDEAGGALLRRSPALAALLLAACAATPLSRHAREHVGRGEPTTLSSESRALLDASLGPRPTRVLVARRLELLRAAPTSLTSDESLALVQSTLDWVELVAHGWSPDWAGDGCAHAPFVPPRPTPCAPGEACDVIGDLDDRSAHASAPTECVARAIRGTWALVERAARGPDAIVAWREAMADLRGSRGTCSPDSEEGAVAVAVLAEVSEFRTQIAGAETVQFGSPDFACTAVGLDGTITGPARHWPLAGRVDSPYTDPYEADPRRDRRSCGA